MRSFISALLMTALVTVSFVACDNSSAPPAVDSGSKPKEQGRTVVPVDYSKGRAMNARLGKGINLGNSWDGDGRNCTDPSSRPLAKEFRPRNSHRRP